MKTRSDEYRKRLLEELEVFFRSHEPRPRQEKRICRVQILVDPLDPLDWLRVQSAAEKTYWAGRDHEFIMAGIGAAATVAGDAPIEYPQLFARLQALLDASNSEIRFYGGLRFDSKRPVDRAWGSFQQYRFVVPRFEILQKPNGTWLAFNFVPGTERDALVSRLSHEMDRLLFDRQPAPTDLPPWRKRRDHPDWAGWEKNVKRALDMFEKGELEKIVLARKSEILFEEELEAVSLLKALTEISPQSFHFCFQIQPGLAFLGITPERLYRRDNGDVYSEAVAGTRARGANPILDQSLGDELLQSEKDLREHRSVSEMVKSSLEPFCDDITVLVRERLLKLPHVQHLQTLFRGHLNNGVSDGELLSRLHPTSAVGGYPRRQSVKRIAEMEPFDRGWYAGPVGWVSRYASEFAVAIRSALVSGDRLSLFAGSGIVRGSDPQKEWEENENKILNFTRLFRRA